MIDWQDQSVMFFVFFSSHAVFSDRNCSCLNIFTTLRFQDYDQVASLKSLTPLFLKDADYETLTAEEAGFSYD